MGDISAVMTLSSLLWVFMAMEVSGAMVYAPGKFMEPDPSDPPQGEVLRPCLAQVIMQEPGEDRTVTESLWER